MMDVRAFSHEKKAETERKLGIKKIKLGHIHQAVAAGFGFRTFAGMQADLSVTGRNIQFGDFKQAYFDARLKELLENENKNKKARKAKETTVSFWT